MIEINEEVSPTLEILALRNSMKICKGVPMFERSEFGYGCKFSLNFSQKIDPDSNRDEFLVLLFQDKRTGKDRKFELFSQVNQPDLNLQKCHL